MKEQLKEKGREREGGSNIFHSPAQKSHKRKLLLKKKWS